MLETLLATYKQEQQRIRQLDPHSIDPLEPQSCLYYWPSQIATWQSAISLGFDYGSTIRRLWGHCYIAESPSLRCLGDSPVWFQYQGQNFSEAIVLIFSYGPYGIFKQPVFPFWLELNLSPSQASKQVLWPSSSCPWFHLMTHIYFPFPPAFNLK